MPLTRGRAAVVMATWLAFEFLSMASARAEMTCPVSDRPVLELLLEVEPPDLAIATNLADHLTTELSLRGIDLCAHPPAPQAPIARVRLHVDRLPHGPVEATIEVFDRITNKRLERTIDLAHIPSDARPLAVASSTDELLRASWVELEVIDAPPPVMAPPPAVVRAVAESQGRRPPPTRASLVSSFEIGADVDASSLPGNREAGGAALELRGWFLPRGAVLLETGGDLGLSRTSIHGTVHVNDLFVTVGTAIAAVPRDRRLGVDLEAGVSFLRVSLGGTASAGATASPAVDWAAVFRLGARAWVRTGPVRWTLGFAGLGVARGSRGIDTGEDVSSIAGLGLEASLGAFIAF